MTIWLFDLDNTLYPNSAGLMNIISARITEFISKRLNLPVALADALRDTYFGRYGSSIGGVLRHCQVDPHEFLHFVHDFPLEAYLIEDLRLNTILKGLPGRKYVFTNAPLDYAQRALRALGVESHFDGIFDLYFASLEGKPSLAAYEKVLSSLERPFGNCWFVDDTLGNHLPAKTVGCTTVLVAAPRPDPPGFIDHVIENVYEVSQLWKSS